MTISKILNSLEKSWVRNDIISKIENGKCTDEIVDDFLINNGAKLRELNTLLKPKDKNLLKQVEQLSTCEAKLLNKINNLDYFKNIENYKNINDEKMLLIKRVPTNKLSSLMVNWSNKFVVIALLVISAIALSKQAWA